ncbi:MAG TPA: fused MFS/spermidine synthase [Saprospiraceae bacterium]|nr:fused MFS/spermidine synthase [Saprospiraceae bacterium]MBP6539448.1 fused MFS/spermidine synthase [Saprospiraceae bacterium]HRG42078.1 fused MFS/spermidine synthase [Saprospiraceae bacterium]
MKPSLVQRLISYITDVHIESVTSDYNETLEVLISHGRYQLCTPNAIYSYADKYDNFRDCFAQLQFERAPIKNVLILGFGLGSIPYMLEKKFYKKYAYTGVEIDDAVIYLASKYVLNELTSEIEMVQADAWSYVVQSGMMYDMICIDIFVDDKIPEVFLTTEFLEATKDLLQPSGLLIYNHLAFLSSDVKSAQQYYDNVFSKVFAQSLPLQVAKNMMMINDKSWLVQK